jgi:hypothetical protein
MPILGIIDSAKAKVTTAFRTISSFTTGSNAASPFAGATIYNQMQVGPFPAAGVVMSVGGYIPGTTFSTVYSASSPNSGWTQRTSYPTTIFQSSVLPLGSNFFQFGGNGLNGTASGGGTNAIRYMGTGLNSWTTSGTTMLASEGSDVQRIENTFIYRYGGATYRGNGLSAWTATTNLPGTATWVGYIKGGQTWALTSGTPATAFSYSNDEGVTWTTSTVVPPVSVSMQYTSNLSTTDAPTQIMTIVNPYAYGQPMAVYSFTGAAFTATSNTPPQGDSTSSIQTPSIFNNYYYLQYNNSAPYYATLS